MPSSSSPRWWSMFDPRTSHGRIYLCLLALRCFSALFGYGYIHPDEWMQSGETYFWLSLANSDAQLTWEWQPNHALRSLSVLLMQYVAVEPMLKIRRLLGGPLTGHSLFLIQRINMLLWSLVLDISIVFFLPPQTTRYVHYLFGISTAATTFLVRPFSNSHEAYLLAFCLLLVANRFKSPTWYQCDRPALPHWGILVGLFAVDGFFMRFTFAIFALPLAAFVFYRHVRLAIQGHPRTALISLSIAITIAIAFFGLRIETETSFYTRLAKMNCMELATFWRTKWVVPPVNALLYNVKTDNVAQHGLHPRWLHAVVNFPMMVGAANCIVVVIQGYLFVRDKVGPSTDIQTAASQEVVEEQEQERKEVERPMDGTTACQVASTSSKPEQACIDEQVAWVDIEATIVALSLWIVVLSLAMLSMSPHQEARFLLALAFPSTIVMAYALQSRFFTHRVRLMRTLCVLHVVQHVVQLVLFSFLHQAALLPTVFSIDTSLSRLTRHADPLLERYEHHLLYRTFSVPFHMLPNKGTAMLPHVEQYDSTYSASKLVYMASIACDHTWIYAPTWVVNHLHAEAHSQQTVDLVQVALFPWHLDLDHLAQTWATTNSVPVTEAFAIQKLHVRCKPNESSQHHISAQTQQDPRKSQSHQDL